MVMKFKYSILICLAAAAALFISCDQEQKLLKDPVTQLSNDCIRACGVNSFQNGIICCFNV